MNNNKRHILFLSSWYPSRVFPTNGDFVQRHAETMAIEHQITIIHVVTDKDVTKKVEIVDKKVNNVRTIIAYVPEKIHLLKFFFFLKTYMKIIKCIDNFDLIHLNITYPKGLIALYLKLLNQKKYIITEHWTDYQYPLNKSIGFLRKQLTKLIVKNAEFVCPVTNNLQTEMIHFGLKGNYKTVPNVVDTDLFIPNKKSSEGFKILHISNMLDSQKNVTGILNTMSKLESKIPNIELVLIGENSEKYKKHANILQLKKITYINHITQQQLVNYFQEASLFLLFSNHENLPCVILESFSSGTPVISTNVGGVSEFFPNNFGTLIPVKDENKLYEEILNFYSKEKILETSTEMHSYAVNNFSKSTICGKFTEIYYESINNKKVI